MGKTVRFSKKQDVSDHVPSPKEQEGRDWKHHKSTEDLSGKGSSKLRHGHFSKQHVWPVIDENTHRGRKV